MKLDNRTEWKSADLRRILHAVCRHDEFVAPAGATVRIVSSRGGYSGWATYGGRNIFEATKDATRRVVPIAMLLRVPVPARGPFDVDRFLGLVWHEVGHWRGLRHRQMSRAMMLSHNFRRADHEWAREAFADLTVGVEPEPPKPPRGTLLLERRAAHAARMLALHERKLAREEKLVRKWATKVRYYEKALHGRTSWARRIEEAE